MHRNGMPHTTIVQGRLANSLIRKVDLKVQKESAPAWQHTPYDSKTLGLQFIHNFLCFPSYPHGI